MKSVIQFCYAFDNLYATMLHINCGGCMRKILLLSIVLSFLVTPLSVFASKKKHHHEAHAHGVGILNVVFERNQGRIEFKAASEAVLGFEHEAKTENDKKKLKDTIVNFETNMSSMIKFNESLGCVFLKDKIEMISDKEENKNKSKVRRAEHSDFIVHFNVNCKKEVKGSTVTVDFSSWKNLNDLDVTFLIDDIQKSIEIKKKPITLDLK